jgi:hypothetical protein
LFGGLLVEARLIAGFKNEVNNYFLLSLSSFPSVGSCLSGPEKDFYRRQRRKQKVGLGIWDAFVYLRFLFVYVFLAALLRIGWTIKRETRGLAAHSFASRLAGRVFAFHDREEIGPRMLARIAKRTGLTPDNLQERSSGH